MQKQSAMGNSAYSSQSQAAASKSYSSSTRSSFSFFPPPPPRPPLPPPVFVTHDYYTGGHSYHVIYRDHGYGYYDPTGLWIAVAAASVLSESDANRYNQVYVNPPPYRGSGHPFVVALIVLGVLGVLGIIAVTLIKGWR